MKHANLGLVLVVGMAATHASAKCDDTLDLKRLTAFTQTVINSKSMKGWDSVEVNFNDSIDILKAGPVTLSSFEGIFRDPFDTLDHVKQFSSNCGADSVSEVKKIWVGSDTIPQHDVNGVYAWGSRLSSGSRTVSEKAKYQYFRRGGYFTVDGGRASDFWEGPSIRLGSDSTFQNIAGWVSVIRAFAIRKPSDWGTGPKYPEASIILNWLPAKRAFRASAEDFLISTMMTASSYVDSIGNGSVDSVRFELRMFKYEYEKRSMSGVHPTGNSKQAIHLNQSGASLSIAMAQPKSVSIVSPSGRVVRRLDAARNVVWDLRDQAGVRVQPGVWFVQVQGLKTVPVVVR